MREYYRDVENNVKQLETMLQTAFNNDRREIAMTLGAAAKLGLFGAAGAAAATAATAAVGTALAAAVAAMAQIKGIALWAKQSQHSPQLLFDSVDTWATLNDDVLDLRERMEDVQRRGMNNQWTGEAKEKWKQFTDRQIAEQRRFEDAVVKVAPLLSDAKKVTENLLMQLSLAAREAHSRGMSIAQRPPAPNPFGLGIGIRTPLVCIILAACAIRFAFLRLGAWIPRTMEITGQLASRGALIKASSL